jgi:hypothetical protein
MGMASVALQDRQATARARVLELVAFATNTKDPGAEGGAPDAHVVEADSGAGSDEESQMIV